MWTDHVRSYSTPTLALGPRLRRVLAEGVDFTAKFGAQSNQALVYMNILRAHRGVAARGGVARWPRPGVFRVFSTGYFKTEYVLQ